MTPETDWMKKFRTKDDLPDLTDLTDLSLPMAEPTPVRSDRKKKRRDRAMSRNFKRGL